MQRNEDLIPPACPAINYPGFFGFFHAPFMSALVLCLILGPVTGMSQVFGIVMGQAQVLPRGDESLASTEVKPENSNLTVYPISVPDILSIHLNDASVIDGYTLANSSGIVITHKDFDIPVHVAQLNLKARPVGEYNLHVRSGNRLFSKRVVKE